MHFLSLNIGNVKLLTCITITEDDLYEGNINGLDLHVEKFSFRKLSVVYLEINWDCFDNYIIIVNRICR